MFNLTALQLHFTCEAVTPLQPGGWRAGANLRGALGNVMRRAYCGHGTPTPAPLARRSQTARTGEGVRAPSPVNASMTGEGWDGGQTTPPPSSRFSTTGEWPGVGDCPVCWLLAANEHPGEERRGYALTPPRETKTSEVSENFRSLYAPGQRFTFGLTLFGDAQRYLPYFILAVPEMGRLGLGARSSASGRGQFALRSVTARDPLEGHDQIVLAEGEALVRVPDQLITPERVQQAADRIVPPDRVRLNFLTPTRLIDNGCLVKAPDFGVLFKRLLERLDELNVQYSGGAPRPAGDVQALQTLANQVRLIESQTQWIELQSGSSRTGRATPISGFIGVADYGAPFGVWRALLPWLVWGTIAQVGKDVVKGNGVFEIVTG